MLYNQDPIVALATPAGMGALAVIRLSGQYVVPIVNRVFRGKDLSKQASHTVHVGLIQRDETTIDEVTVALFLAPRSFTREDSVEITCHGSPFVVAQLLQLFVERGVRMAHPGEFTKRAFLNGRLDLTQAEAVADLIAADSARAHQTALNQMRGGFTLQIKELRRKLVRFSALIGVELDFSEEEDVPAVDRNQLKALAQALVEQVTTLLDSFRYGNVLKEGVAVAIVGKPNVGKSTLLNQLLQEERAIVSAVAGTTRDVIEGRVHVGGFLFRFADTAGLRDTTSDEIEAIGMERTRQQLHKSDLLLYVADASEQSFEQAEATLCGLSLPDLPLLKIGNKVDASPPSLCRSFEGTEYLLLSAQQQEAAALLKQQLAAWAQPAASIDASGVVVNARHYEHLLRSKEELQLLLLGLERGIPNELLAVDIRNALHPLGNITGEITCNDVLKEIFSSFCIGK